MRKFLTILFSLALVFLLQSILFQENKAKASQLQTIQQVTNSNDNQCSENSFWFKTFMDHTGFSNATVGHLIMILLGLVFIFIAIKYHYEPLLLIPIGAGILLGNIPFLHNANLQIGVYEEGSTLNYLYGGIIKGIYPSLIFLGIGAMTDFSTLISNPKLLLLGIAAQIGIFASFIGASLFGFHPSEAAAIGIIGSADGPSSIYIASKLTNGIKLLADGSHSLNLIAPISVAAYTFMALVPIIQPPIMRLMTSRSEREIRMKAPRTVTRSEKILFSIICLLVTCFISPSALPLLGMLFFGNLLKESGVTKRLAETAKTTLLDIVTILLGLTIGAATQADMLPIGPTIKIFIVGLLAFIVATFSGLLFAKLMNVFLRGDKKINPLIGAAGVSALPDSAMVVHSYGLKADSKNHLLMHAMAPNAAGIIGSALAAGILLSYLG